MPERHERIGGLRETPEPVVSEAGGLDDLQDQLYSLRRVQFVTAFLLAAVLVFLMAEFLVSSRDVAVMNRDNAAIAGKVDGLATEVSRVRKVVSGVPATRAMVEEIEEGLRAWARAGGGSSPSGPKDWTGVVVSDLTPLLPYLADFESGTGELWLYSNSEAFLGRIEEALLALEKTGMEVDVENAQ
jgi:hypothetical protein